MGRFGMDRNFLANLLVFCNNRHSLVLFDQRLSYSWRPSAYGRENKQYQLFLILGIGETDNLQTVAKLNYSVYNTRSYNMFRSFTCRPPQTRWEGKSSEYYTGPFSSKLIHPSSVPFCTVPGQSAELMKRPHLKAVLLQSTMTCITVVA